MTLTDCQRRPGVEDWRMRMQDIRAEFTNHFVQALPQALHVRYLRDHRELGKDWRYRRRPQELKPID